MSKIENILLEYQKTIPKSLRIITNISYTDFFNELDNLDKIGKLSEVSISDVFSKNICRFPIPDIFFKDTKYEIVFRNHIASKWHYDNKQLIKHKISDMQKIHSLQIISMDYVVKIQFNILSLFIWILIILTLQVENFIFMMK
jgi:hypothetical protein